VLTQRQVNRFMRAARSADERALLEVLYGTGARVGEITSMRVEDVDFKERRIRVKGKTGIRFVQFLKQTGDALSRYIGTRRKGYVFVDSKPLQRLLPVRIKGGAWRCRWREYDSRGAGFEIVEAYVRAIEKLTYHQAVAHFSKLTTPSRIARPLGLRPLTIDAITKKVKKIGLRVGISACPQTFRHCFATHLHDNGAEIEVIQQLLGHKSIKSTMVYAHISKRRIRSTFERCHPRKHLNRDQKGNLNNGGNTKTA
jgi:site-specific recombinase XerD